MTAKSKQLLSQAEAAGKPLRRTGRDSQRQKVYHAEQRVLRPGQRQLSPREVNELVRKIRTSAYVVRNYGDPGHVKVTITRQRKATSAAFPFRGEIRLAAAWGCSADVVVHEMAHMYASPMGDPGHDWLFCHIYLDFVRKFIGAKEAAALKAEFKRTKVRVAPPRKRKAMSPAQKAAAAERMAKARAARQGSSIEPHVIVIPKKEFGEDAGWVLLAGSTIPKSGWLKTTRRASDPWRGGLYDKVFVRKTDTGIAQALAKVRTWPGASEAVAVPVSQLQSDERGFLRLTWEPILVPVA